MKFGSTLIAILLSISLQSSALGVVVPASKAVSGVTYSWVVTFHNTTDGDRGEHVCMGALIDDYTVITAAHCLVALANEDWVLVQGRLNSADRGRVLTAFDFKLHPDYDPITSDNDIAVIYLYYPAYATKHLKLANQNAKFTTGDLFLYGWGNDEKGKITYQLRQAKQQLAKKAAISKYFKNYNSTTQLATLFFNKSKGAYASACVGDSGGPLVKSIGRNDHLVGIVSYGAAKCNTDAPTVFTKIAEFRNWISTNQAELKRKHATDISISTEPFYVTGGKTLPSSSVNDPIYGSSIQTTVRLVTGDLPNTEIDILNLTVNSYSSPQSYGDISLTATNVGAWDACSLTTRGFIEARIDIDGKLGSDLIWQWGDVSSGCITDGAEMILVKANSVPPVDCKARIQTTTKGPQVWISSSCFGGSKTALFRMLLSDGQMGDVEPGSDNWMGPVVIKLN